MAVGGFATYCHRRDHALVQEQQQKLLMNDEQVFFLQLRVADLGKELAEATAKAATCASEREGGRTQAREVGKQLAEAAQTKDEHTFTSCWSLLSLRQLF